MERCVNFLMVKKCHEVKIILLIISIFLLYFCHISCFRFHKIAQIIPNQLSTRKNSFFRPYYVLSILCSNIANITLSKSSFSTRSDFIDSKYYKYNTTRKEITRKKI